MYAVPNRVCLVDAVTHRVSPICPPPPPPRRLGTDPIATGQGRRRAEADGQGRAAKRGRVPHQPHEDCLRLLPAPQTGVLVVAFAVLFLALAGFGRHSLGATNAGAY